MPLQEIYVISENYFSRVSLPQMKSLFKHLKNIRSKQRLRAIVMRFIAKIAKDVNTNFVYGLLACTSQELNIKKFKLRYFLQK